jgi:hypothetical protein
MDILKKVIPKSFTRFIDETDVFILFFVPLIFGLVMFFSGRYILLHTNIIVKDSINEVLVVAMYFGFGISGLSLVIKKEIPQIAPGVTLKGFIVVLIGVLIIIYCIIGIIVKLLRL